MSARTGLDLGLMLCKLPMLVWLRAVPGQLCMYSTQLLCLCAVCLKRPPLLRQTPPLSVYLCCMYAALLCCLYFSPNPNPSHPGAGVDWRQKVENQRGAVLARILLPQP